jgi:predicted 3-demethylubiquinone-9 3-methyltransferase (glyoxalase superfamily)
MQKITPHLWFDIEALDAANLYTRAFKDVVIKKVTRINNTPSGTASLVTVEILGQTFNLLNAGPFFKFNPSISFLVACKTRDEVDSIWKVLSEGGNALMGLGDYPFSHRYGWIQDKYGVSWQVMLTGIHDIGQRITPTLMFVGAVHGKVEEAINFYASVFHDSKVGDVLRYGKGMEPDEEGTVQHAGFMLEGQMFAAMDSAREHSFSFNEAVSFVVHCESQAEVDYYWGRLSADPKAELCGWLKDMFGISWQIVPTVLDEMLASADVKKVSRVTDAFLKMKKFDIAKLKKAYEGV